MWRGCGFTKLWFSSLVQDQLWLGSSLVLLEAPPPPAMISSPPFIFRFLNVTLLQQNHQNQKLLPSAHWDSCFLVLLWKNKNCISHQPQLKICSKAVLPL